jgi:hypothetical protein
MMPKFDPPFVEKDDPDRALRCQDAIHIQFRDFITDAVASGWGEDEVLLAILDLADNYVRMRAADGELEAMLALLKSKKI